MKSKIKIISSKANFASHRVGEAFSRGEAFT